MAAPGTRTLRLLSLLQSRRYWSGDELAVRLEVSSRTLRRDIDRLRDLGYPVEAQRGLDGGYQLAAGAVLPPLLLDDEEAVAIGVGLHSAIQAGTVTGIEESSVRALSKVILVMPSRLRRRIDALAAMTVPVPWQEPPNQRRRRRAGVGGPGLPGCRTPSLHLYRPRRRAEYPRGRPPPAGPAGETVVPGGLGSDSLRLADLSPRSPGGTQGHRGPGDPPTIPGQGCGGVRPIQYRERPPAIPGGGTHPCHRGHRPRAHRTMG